MYMTKYDVFCTVFENWINNITILTTENYIGAIKAFSMELHIAVVTLDCFLIFQAAFRAHTAGILHWARFSELLPDSSIRQEAVSVKFTKWQKTFPFKHAGRIDPWREWRDTPGKFQATWHSWSAFNATKTKSHSPRVSTGEYEGLRSSTSVRNKSKMTDWSSKRLAMTQPNFSLE